jgi:two-component system response regulator DevR
MAGSRSTPPCDVEYARRKVYGLTLYEHLWATDGELERRADSRAKTGALGRADQRQVTATAMATRIFLVDDHEVIRQGIGALLRAESDLEIVGEAASTTEALTRAPAAAPDVAILDVRLPDGNGVELCRDLRSRFPDLRCLILTSYADHEALVDAIMAGAAGFVLKEVVGSELVSAIRTVAAGESLIDVKMTAGLLTQLRRQQDRVDPLHKLTARERLLLDLIGEGLTNRQIAQRMYLAEKTVKNYVSRLLDKLDMQRRTQAAALAAELRFARDAGVSRE